MKVQNTITFIVSKNYGPPLSLSIPVWRFYSGLVLFGVVVGVLVVLGVAFLITQPSVRQIQEENHHLRQERDALREQILSSYLEQYETKAVRFVAQRDDAGGDKDDDAIELSVFDGEIFQPPIRVDSYSLRVNGRYLEVGFRLQNQGDDQRNRGGFLFAIFENEEASPTRYLASPTVHVNEEGFPQTYKSGIRFTRISHAVTFRRRVKRESRDEFYTHVTLFLFSVRGGLLLKERFELERELFFKDKTAQSTQVNTKA